MNHETNGASLMGAALGVGAVAEGRSLSEKEWVTRQRVAGLKQTLDRINGSIDAFIAHGVDAKEADNRLLRSDLQNAIQHCRNLASKLTELRNEVPTTAGQGRKKAEQPQAASAPQAETREEVKEVA